MKEGSRIGRISLTVVLAVVIVAALQMANGSGTRHASAHGVQARQAAAGSVGKGKERRVSYSRKPPRVSRSQVKTLEKRTAKTEGSGPSGPLPAIPKEKNPGAPIGTPSGHLSMAAQASHRPVSARPTDLVIFRNTVMPSIQSGNSSQWSYIQEPSNAARGKYAIHTGNWFAAHSQDNGRTWRYLDPYNVFGKGFCCDQLVVYAPAYDRLFWLLQYDDHLTLANTSMTGGASSWCYYEIRPSWFAQSANTDLDYNDMLVGGRFLYLTTNLFPKGTNKQGSGLLRLPIAEMARCAAFHYTRIARYDTFTFELAQGAAGTMYWGSNWFDKASKNGRYFRVYSWPDTSNTYHWVDRKIDPFEFMRRGKNPGHCESRNGVVKNWCEYADSRPLSGYLARGTLGFAFNAREGKGFPFPYSRRVYFSQAGLRYRGSTKLWSKSVAIEFLKLAPNRNGHIGGVFSWGGGTGREYFYPGSGILIDDDVAPRQPWSVDFYLHGHGNTCKYSGKYRWGDYMSVNQFYPSQAGAAWSGAGWAIEGANCGTGNWYAQPHDLIFGRRRDASSVYRWWNR